MREEKYLTIVTMLTEATRKGRVRWKPLGGGEWEEYIAVLPDKEVFILRGSAEGRLWDLEVREANDELMECSHGKPRTGTRHLDAAIGELVAAVQAATEVDLDKTISVLRELSE